jgi:hypothetical protein
MMTAILLDGDALAQDLSAGTLEAAQGEVC